MPSSPYPLPKRPRGRPPGTGKDDSVLLSKAADMLLADPKLKPTSAIKRTLDMTKPGASSAVRRLQMKWKEHATELKKAAVQRGEERVRRIEASRESRQQMVARLSARIADPKLPDDLARSLGFANMHHAQRSVASAVEQLQRHVRELEASGFMREIRKMYESPAVEEMRRMQEARRVAFSPTTLKMIADIEARQQQITAPSREIMERLARLASPPLGK